MAKLTEIRKLSELFYKDYPSDLYPEMEHKEGRPYIVLLLTIDDNKFAVPLRTNIRHNYCYKFKTSDRQTDTSTGIDFTKTVLIVKKEYLGELTDINDKEYLELQNKEFYIVGKIKTYIKGYVDYRKNGGNKSKEKKYMYCTLKYFDEILLK